MGSIDPYNLQRFVDAQTTVFEQVCAELRSGHKTSHWMWFVFPQIEGLGHSSMARHFAIASAAEAVAYARHPVLGPRLEDCTKIVLGVSGRSAHEIFGSPDDVKFRSSMTLFAETVEKNQIFKEALDKYFQGERDSRTLAILGGTK